MKKEGYGDNFLKKWPRANKIRFRIANCYFTSDMKVMGTV